jgi:hypothetical protein
MREERRLRVFENRVLRRIFGPKRDEVTRKWRKLYKRPKRVVILTKQKLVVFRRVSTPGIEP